MQKKTEESVLKLLREYGELTVPQLLKELQKEKVSIERSALNSLLYGELRSLVTKDVDREGVQIWRLTQQKFTATKGLEFRLYQELLHRKIITPENAQLDYAVTNRRNRKVYHLDIAIFPESFPKNVIPAQAGIHGSPVGAGDDRSIRKLNIEVDGFDHLRADAMYSIQKQLREGRKEIEIDWMDHERSFIDFKSIDSEKVSQWCTRNAAWCRRFHEELIWPKDITRNLWLIENGWEIMRVWNFEVRDDLKRIVKEIEEWIK